MRITSVHACHGPGSSRLTVTFLAPGRHEQCDGPRVRPPYKQEVFYEGEAVPWRPLEAAPSGRCVIAVAVVVSASPVWAGPVDGEPDPSGMPGAALVRQLINWLMWASLMASLGAVLVGAAMWRGGTTFGNTIRGGGRPPLRRWRRDRSAACRSGRRADQHPLRGRPNWGLIDGRPSPHGVRHVRRGDRRYRVRVTAHRLAITAITWRPHRQPRRHRAIPRGPSRRRGSRPRRSRTCASTDTLMAHSPIGRHEILEQLVLPRTLDEQAAAPRRRDCGDGDEDGSYRSNDWPGSRRR